MGATCCCQYQDAGTNSQEIHPLPTLSKDSAAQLATQETDVQDTVVDPTTPVAAADSEHAIQLPTLSKDLESPDSRATNSEENASPLSKKTTSAKSPVTVVSTTTSLQVQVSNPEQVQVERPVDEAEVASLRELQAASDPVRKWLYSSIVSWRDLPVGDACDGKLFLQTAESISGIYPYVFSLAYACKHLSKDLNEQIEVSRKHWPAGAVTCREAVRGEVANIGIPEIEKKYWNTYTCRMLWVVRAMRIMFLILLAICESDNDPVKCAQNALNTVCGDVLNSGLKKVADFIIWFCVFKKRPKLFANMSLPEKEAQKYIAILVKYLKPHVVAMQGMFDEEVPSVVKKRP